MKNLIHLLFTKIKKSLFVLILSSVILSSCTNKQKEKLVTSVIIDVTGSNTSSLQSISPSQVIKTIEVDKYNAFEHNYRQALITESFLSEKREYHLEARPMWLIANEYDRESQVKTFKQQIAESLLEIKRYLRKRSQQCVYKSCKGVKSFS